MGDLVLYAGYTLIVLGAHLLGYAIGRYDQRIARQEEQAAKLKVYTRRISWQDGNTTHSYVIENGQITRYETSIPLTA